MIHPAVGLSLPILSVTRLVTDAPDALLPGPVLAAPVQSTSLCCSPALFPSWWQPAASSVVPPSSSTASSLFASCHGQKLGTLLTACLTCFYHVSAPSRSSQAVAQQQIFKSMITLPAKRNPEPLTCHASEHHISHACAAGARQEALTANAAAHFSIMAAHLEEAPLLPPCPLWPITTSGSPLLPPAYCQLVPPACRHCSAPHWLCHTPMANPCSRSPPASRSRWMLGCWLPLRTASHPPRP